MSPQVLRGRVGAPGARVRGRQEIRRSIKTRALSARAYFSPAEDHVFQSRREERACQGRRTAGGGGCRPRPPLYRRPRRAAFARDARIGGGATGGRGRPTTSLGIVARFRLRVFPSSGGAVLGLPGIPKRSGRPRHAVPRAVSAKPEPRRDSARRTTLAGGRLGKAPRRPSLGSSSSTAAAVTDKEGLPLHRPAAPVVRRDRGSETRGRPPKETLGVPGRESGARAAGVAGPEVVAVGTSMQGASPNGQAGRQAVATPSTSHTQAGCRATRDAREGGRFRHRRDSRTLKLNLVKKRGERPAKTDV